MPFILMSALLMASGIVRQMENRSRPGPGGVTIPGTSIATNYNIEVPTLHHQVFRDPRLGAEGDGLETGLRYLSRQAVCIGGGTSELARNVIGERVLNFPREYAADRGVPFNQVKHGKADPT